MLLCESPHSRTATLPPKRLTFRLTAYRLLAYRLPLPVAVMKTLMTTDGSKEATTALLTASRLLRKSRNEVGVLCGRSITTQC